MRVAVVTGRFPVLSESPYLNQVAGLVRRGHEVDVYADQPQADVPFHPDVERLGLQERTRYRLRLGRPLHRRLAQGARLILAHRGSDRAALVRSLNPLLVGRRAFSLEQVGRTAACLPRRPYDICYCPFGHDAFKAARLRRVGALGGKWVTAFRGSDLTSYMARRGQHTYRRLFREGDLFLPVSDEFARRLVRLGCPPSRVVVHRTGVDLRRWQFRPRYPDAEGRLRVVTVARLVEKKGIEYALRALHALAAEGLAAEYEVLGDGPLHRPLAHLAAELGLGERVRFLGWQAQSEVRAALDRAHVLVAPSVRAGNADEEGIPTVLKEAMAAGLPVVATRHSGIPELVEDGVSGFLIPERDPAALAERLRRLRDYPEAWPALGAAGRAKVVREYDIEKLNDRLVELFQQIAHP